VRIDGPKAWDERFHIDWYFTDLDERWRTTLSNGVFVPERDPRPADVDMALSLTKPQLVSLLVAQGIDGIDMQGDVSVLGRLVAVVDTVDRNFPIVTP
jgi:alkyl sulfatase BDS1-like metallo-beta-lactamase superfamily hydrolase